MLLEKTQNLSREVRRNTPLCMRSVIWCSSAVADAAIPSVLVGRGDAY